MRCAYCRGLETNGSLVDAAEYVVQLQILYVSCTTMAVPSRDLKLAKKCVEVLLPPLHM
jgi:hypothetical protein